MTASIASWPTIFRHWLTFEIDQVFGERTCCLLMDCLVQLIRLALLTISHFIRVWLLRRVLMWSASEKWANYWRMSLNFILWKEKPRIPRLQLKLLSPGPRNWLTLRLVASLIQFLDPREHAHWPSLALHLRVAQRLQLGWTTGTPHD